MEKDLGSRFHYQHPEWQLPYLNISRDPLIVAGQSSVPAYMQPYLNPANGVSSLAAYSGVPLSKPSQHNAPFNWFYCLPRNRQASASPLSSMPKDALASEQMEYGGVNGWSKAEHDSGQRRFLVFDQSGDQTKLIYTSAVGTPAQNPAAWNPKPPATCDFIKEEFISMRDATSQHSPSVNVAHYEENPYDLQSEMPSVNVAHDEENPDDLQSEMYEDTEEINALLCSDDEDDYSDDDEVASTGHSPSTMTDHGTQHWPEGGDDEVASAASPCKRQKLLNVEFNDKVYAGGFEKPFDLTEFESDAESGCGRIDIQVQEKPFTGKKRSRNDNIRETVTVLRNIIPRAKGKDPLVVIDEAIHYLKSLKLKVQSSGLEAL